ncbi:unnamed protein product, partial [Brenthis ino]
MLGVFLYIFEVKKEFLVCISLSILYITYYLVEVVKKPILICRKGEFRQFLEENVPLLSEPYWPTPWCVESRLQTVIGSVLRSYLLPRIEYRREVLRLSDGGQVALDWAEVPGGEARPVMLVLPGLTGGAQADYVRCLAAAARRLGVHCVVVAAVRGAARGPLLAVGVSLGGLILGHYLAEHAEAAARALAAALVVSSPLDVTRGAECMERPLNALLSWHMARNLRNTVRAHAPLLAGGAALERCRSVRAFDRAFTAEHFGFASAEAYYREASLAGKLARVRVPLLCLCAGDDPFQPHGVLPLAEAARSAGVALAVTARGGHIGFLEGWWPAPPARAAHDQYIARLAAQYFGALLRRDPRAPPLCAPADGHSEYYH